MSLCVYIYFCVYIYIHTTESQGAIFHHQQRRGLSISINVCIYVHIYIGHRNSWVPYGIINNEEGLFMSVHICVHVYICVHIYVCRRISGVQYCIIQQRRGPLHINTHMYAYMFIYRYATELQWCHISLSTAKRASLYQKIYVYIYVHIYICCWTSGVPYLILNNEEGLSTSVNICIHIWSYIYRSWNIRGAIFHHQQRRGPLWRAAPRGAPWLKHVCDIPYANMRHEHYSREIWPVHVCGHTSIWNARSVFINAMPVACHCIRIYLHIWIWRGPLFCWWYCLM